MQAFEAVKSQGLNISWPDFKRIAGQLKLNFDQKQPKLVRRFLTDQEIHRMGEQAKHDFFFSCSWKSAFQAAIEFAADNFNVRATKAQAATAINIAKMLWDEEVLQVKKDFRGGRVMKTVDVTPQNWLWLFDIALRQNDDKLIKEALEYGKRLEERRLKENK